MRGTMDGVWGMCCVVCGVRCVLRISIFVFRVSRFFYFHTLLLLISSFARKASSRSMPLLLAMAQM